MKRQGLNENIKGTYGKSPIKMEVLRRHQVRFENLVPFGNLTWPRKIHICVYVYSVYVSVFVYAYVFVSVSVTVYVNV